MSMIHRSSALLGRRSALMAGTARCRTVRSMTYSTHARAITARPIHSLRPALGGGEVPVSRCIGCLRFSAVTGFGPPAAPELIGGPAVWAAYAQQIKQKERTTHSDAPQQVE